MYHSKRKTVRGRHGCHRRTSGERNSALPPRHAEPGVLSPERRSLFARRLRHPPLQNARSTQTRACASSTRRRHRMHTMHSALLEAGILNSSSHYERCLATQRRHRGTTPGSTSFRPFGVNSGSRPSQKGWYILHKFKRHYRGSSRTHGSVHDNNESSPLRSL